MRVTTFARQWLYFIASSAHELALELPTELDAICILVEDLLGHFSINTFGIEQQAILIMMIPF